MNAEFHPQGDQAVVIELGQTIELSAHQRVKQLSNHLDHHPPEWMIEYIPAFTTVTIIYDPVFVHKRLSSSKLPYQTVCEELSKRITPLTDSIEQSPRIVEIPVCYGGELGPDLSYVAEENDLTEKEVIDIHKSGEYLVYMIGFAPGFPYIGGMDEKISTPRKDEPRLTIPAGSVGIAGGQTGVYPIETPGGWQLIGRTPLNLFNPDRDVPSLLQAGDKIKFFSITPDEYESMKEDE